MKEYLLQETYTVAWICLTGSWTKSPNPRWCPGIRGLGTAPIKRLEARPIATLSIEAQERYEQMKRITQAGHRKWSPLEGGETMKVYKIDNLVGIYEEDRSVKCRDCMKEKDWKDLKQENIITLDDVENGEKLFYCDYCEEKL